MSERLIYGKNDMKYIVSIEVDGETASIFREKDGKVKREVVPHKYWLLCNEKLDSNYNELIGNQHYKYGKQFSTYRGYMTERNKYQDADFYSVKHTAEALQIKDGYTYYKGLTHTEVSILAFDIETTGLTHDDTSKVLLIANTFRSNGVIIRKLFSYDDYENDGEMIADWCRWVQEMNPALVCGHNIYYFDLPYLSYVASRYGKELVMGRNDSPIKYNQFDSKFRIDGSRDLTYRKARIYGREIIDTMFLSYKYDIGRKYESYGLKSIIAHEKLEKEGRVFYDAGKIKDNYLNPEEWEKIKQYAMDDGDDALALYDLMIPPTFYFTQNIPKPMQLMVESATGSQLNALLVRSYLQERHSVPKATAVEEFQGAYSLGIPGIYRNVFKIDVKSEYPSCILQYNIYDKEKDPKANFLKMVQYFTDQRFKDKQMYKETGDKYYYYLEQSRKTGINSAYGLLNAQGLNFNSPKNAAIVTEMGRKTIDTATIWASGRNVEHWLEVLENGKK